MVWLQHVFAPTNMGQTVAASGRIIFKANSKVQIHSLTVVLCCVPHCAAGGLPEQQLLVACGVAPRGKLAIVRSGCGLMPAMLDGPELPVSCCMLGVGLCMLRVSVLGHLCWMVG